MDNLWNDIVIRVIGNGLIRLFGEVLMYGGMVLGLGRVVAQAASLFSPSHKENQDDAALSYKESTPCK